MADAADLQAKLKALSDAYAAQLPEKLGQLMPAWDQLPQSGWDEEGFQTFYRMVHSLSGSGKTFGFAALSETARNLEDYLKPLGDAKNALNEGQRGQVKRMLGELRLASSRRDIAAFAQPQPQPVAVSPYSSIANVACRVFIVEDDPALAEELEVQLHYFGYEVLVFHKPGDFRDAMQQNPAGVALMDVNFSEDAMGGINVMAELQRGRDMPLPVIFLSAHNDLEVRLGAVRAGGIAYLGKPVNIGALVDELDKLTSSQPRAAYRVLIVDDEVELALYYAAALEKAGMLVEVVNDPLKVMKPLLEFAPDLILIDMYMPGCNGMELAGAIRQINAFVSVPIVFLSAETDPDKQISVLGSGADDFLTKPIKTRQLVASITSRIQRSLILRSFMVRDSLTGLLNHTAIKEQLSHEVARARRQGKPLAFAMVDIDHFKNVNDTYGHPAGDRVIKSLSRLLKQRLRENDMVGRYGGEEFAAVLVDADGPAAMRVMDAIRNDFAQLRHLAEDREFSASFSCGIADISNYGVASKLVDAADKALYKAKHAGRNQVVLADEKFA